MKRRRFVAASLAAVAALFGGTGAEAAPKRRKASPARKSTTKKAAKGSRTAPRPTPEPKQHVAEDAPAIREPDVPWRHYDLTTEVMLPSAMAPVRLWLPLPLAGDTSWQRTIEHTWTTNADQAGLYNDAENDLHVLHAEWQAGKPVQLKLTSGIALRDRQFDVTQRNAPPERPEVLRRYLRSSPRLPTDGAVRATAERIIGRIKDPVAQGKALYDWVAERTRFASGGSGVGQGDIVAILERPETAGRCADINGLFVALARSIGLPARLTFGLRIDQSRIVASLGQRGELADAQHCRAEFYAPGYSWIPVDPADVRKALAEDSSTLDGMKGTVLRKLLFGFWEPNWVSLNRAQNAALRHAETPAVASLATPYLEISGKPHAWSHDAKISIKAKRGPDLG